MEKRKERRFKQWNKTSVKSASGPQGVGDLAGVDAYTYDISLGGAKLYADVELPVGTPIRMHVEMVRSKDSIGIDGVVRWSKRNTDYNVFEMGVEFFHVIPKTALTLMHNLYEQGTGIPTRLSRYQGPTPRKE
jgi:c-di-GMP-binding flagellar brake protein YcgR